MPSTPTADGAELPPSSTPQTALKTTSKALAPAGGAASPVPALQLVGDAAGGSEQPSPTEPKGDIPVRSVPYWALYK